jgi:hypothetical protein
MLTAKPGGARIMEFGIGIPTSGESWKVVQRAEELGFTHAWFYDTQMLVGDLMPPLIPDR